MSTTIESLELQIQSNSTSATNGIDALSASLSKLKNAIKGGVGLTSVANQIRNLDTALKSLDDSSISKIDKLANSLSKLSTLGKVKISSSIASQLRNIGGATATLSTVDFSSLDRLGQALSPLTSIGKASGLRSVITQLGKLPELARTLDGINWNQFTSQLRMLSDALRPLVNQLNTVSNAFGRLPANLRRTISATNSLSASNNRASSSYVDLWAKSRMAMNVVRGSARAIAGWITESNNYVENLNLFTASMGDYASEAKRYAEQVGEVMGIDPGEFMRNQGVFMTITEGFGVASERAYTMSKNLTQLGYDLSSFFNISFADSMQKLTSGISGELEPLRRLGYDLSQARLKAVALSLGIKKSFNDMTQAEKAQLRYYAIMTQVTKAQGDMSRTLNAPANQLRILKAQLVQAGRALGNIFIPALNAVLPYAIALAKVIRIIADSIANLVGFKLPEIDYSGLKAGGSAIGDLAANADEAGAGLGKAGKKAKKLKDALLGIDELNIISEDKMNALDGLGEGLGGGDLGFELPEYDFLTGAVNAKVEEIVSMIKGALSEITAVISTFLLAIGTILVVTGANIPLGLGLMAVGAVGLVATIVQNWGEMTERLAKTLTIITALLGGFLLAVGAILVLSGANVPLGIGLMIAGAVALGTAATINWKFLHGDLINALSILTSIVSGALLAMGALFAFTGANIPLGVGLMLAGAVGLATAVGLNWKGMSDPMRKAIGVLEAIVGGALLTFGAILALTGVNIPLGVGMIAAGAISLVSAAALNWGSLTGDLKKSISTITALVSGALIGVGAVLAFTGVATPLGISMIAAGAIGIVSTAALNWGALTEKVKKVLKEIGIAVGASLLALGAVLAFTGVALPVGIALMAAGATSLVAGIALNWNSIVKKIKDVLKKIGVIAGASMLALGVILCLTGVGIPLGAALIAAGAGSLVSGIALNWDTIVTKVGEGLNAIANKFGEFKDWVGDKLSQAGDAISEWAGGVKEFFVKGKDGKNALDNITETAAEWGQGFLDGISGCFSGMGSWVKNNIFSPIDKAIAKSPIPEFTVKLKNTASTWWNNAKSWWTENTKDGLTLESGVKLVKSGWNSVTSWIGNLPIVKQGVGLLKSGWKSVSDWVGNIPIVKQGVNLVKSGWQSVKSWLGNIPTVSQAVNLVKSGWQSVKNWIGHIPTLSQTISLLKKGWTTVKGWIGNIPTLSQAISLIKSGWTTIKNWVGHIPILSQGISLLKSGWTTVKGWIGNIPIVSQGISLIKSGWNTVKSWIGDHIVPTGISLFKSGWKSLSSWIGDKVSVGISLFKDGWNSIKGFFGLSTGGYNTGHGFKMFAKGGFIGANGKSGFWKSVPMYANGTANAGLHGSLFVAGESGAEMVGHINGQTEVLNQSQIKLAMRSAVISGMAQFTGYWRAIHGQIAIGANAVIRSILVNTEVLNAAIMNNPHYDPSNTLAQSIYDDSQRAFNHSLSDESMARTMKEFYREYVEPTLKEIASDTKRQADKEEQTIVQIGNRTITDAVVTQKRVNGFVFAE